MLCGSVSVTGFRRLFEMYFVHSTLLLLLRYAKLEGLTHIVFDSSKLVRTEKKEVLVDPLIGSAPSETPAN